MQELHEKVAVVTGAASGIGRSIAEALAAEGMRLVLADVDVAGLEAAANSLDALAVPTDVARASDVETLSARAFAAHGAVHLLVSNAGVGRGGRAWEQPLADWEHVLGVNLWGPIHGVRAFVPRMIEQKQPAHIVNVASIAGVTANPMMAAYNVSKHGVVVLSETLAHDLALAGVPIGVTCVCPGWVRTRIAEAAPPGDLWRTLVEAGLPPAEVAAAVVRAVREDRFWVFTHPHFLKAARMRMEEMLAQRNPSLPPAPRT